MMQENRERFMEHILSVMELMEASGNQLWEAYQKQEDLLQTCFNDVLAGVNCLREVYPQIKGELNHAYYMPMLSNIDDTLFRIERAVNNGDEEKILVLLRYQLPSFLLELIEEFRFWCMVYPDREKMRQYYRHEFVFRHENKYMSAERLPYEVSIFIPVYNKLEYTKRCIESICKNTDFSRHKCEFIIINDGSTDGTEKYLDSLGIQKVIHLKENVKAAIFTTAFRICEGNYFLFVNNDTIATKGWLDNLLNCMESDTEIISATPCTPNTSNYQEDISQSFPKEWRALDGFCNQPDPALWEDRARIMPVIALYRAKLLNTLGFADRLFYTLECWDDDFSLRARRAGYRQIICRDTYCHHFGSVTGARDKEENNTLDLGKRLFRFKNGVAAWSIGFCYDVPLIEQVKTNGLRKRGKLCVLGIDCGFGDTLLKLRDFYRKCGNEVAVDSITTDKRYLPDLSFLAGKNIFAADLEQELVMLPSNQYDYIYISEKIEVYEDVSVFLPQLHRLLKRGGVLLFNIRNLFYGPTMKLLGQGIFPGKGESVSYLNPMILQKEIVKIFEKHDCIPVWGDETADHSAGQLTAVEQFVYYCEKADGRSVLEIERQREI